MIYHFIASFIYLMLYSCAKTSDLKNEHQRTTGLISAGTSGFTLNGKPFRIMSGSIHYFRIPKEYWQDRLQKLKDCGLNTVETYIPWNAHEKRPGKFDFTGNLDLLDFIDKAEKLGLYVILRPGPYICAEWEFGGLPAWLLSDKNMVVRSLYSGFMQAVRRYFQHLLPLLAPKQYTKGGPIIAFQIENEYHSYGKEMGYLKALDAMYREFGLMELFFVSNNAKAIVKIDDAANALPNVQSTINGQHNISEALDILANHQPNKPLMVAEFWTGWFDHWGEPHKTFDLEPYEKEFSAILRRNASFNLYMFAGGTNFGFWNGANLGPVFDNGTTNKSFGYQPVITSYDYDAPIAESGKLTTKYNLTKKLIKEYVPEVEWPNTEPGIYVQAFDYLYTLVCNYYASLTDVLNAMKPIGSVVTPKVVEYLCNEIGGNTCNAPLLGFVAYRNNVSTTCKMLSLRGTLGDRMQIIVNGRTIETMYQNQTNRPFNIDIPLHDEFLNTSISNNSAVDLILLVEIMGRIHIGESLDNQRKGFDGRVYCTTNDANIEPMTNWKVYDLSFDDENYFDKITWKKYDEGTQFDQPTFYGFKHRVPRPDADPHDYYLTFMGWDKGVGFINGFNLGRYWIKGPELTLFIPASLLKNDSVDTIVMFELHPIILPWIMVQSRPILS